MPISPLHVKQENFRYHHAQFPLAHLMDIRKANQLHRPVMRQVPVASSSQMVRTAQAQPDKRSQILQALQGRIEPIRTSPLYLMALAPVALLMLLLPLVYLCLIAAVGYGVYWHATNDISVFQNIHSIWVFLIAYVGPIIAGGVVIFFMIKPFFSRRSATGKPFAVTREEEPLLYEFVDRLCDVVGARKPHRILIDCRANAAAGFNGASGLITGRRVLLIGLSLPAGLDLRDFTGVLAHELGHFRQRSGMRLSYIIRALNVWFARAVFQRDRWDLALLRASRRGHFVIVLICLLCRTVLGLTRLILRGFMWIGAMFSAVLMRQGEFAADRYEIQVSGTEAFVQTTNRIVALNLAFEVSMAELSDVWRERRLADDLPMLVSTREADFDSRVRQKLDHQLVKTKVGLFSTHPSSMERISAAREINAPGIFNLDMPATALFTDFKELSRMATLELYQRVLGKALRAEHVHTSESIVERRETRRQSNSALDRYFQGLISPLRPLNILAAEPAPASADDRAVIIMQARTLLTDHAEQALADAKAFDDAQSAIQRVLAVRTMQNAQIKFQPKDLNFQSGDPAELKEIEQQAQMVSQHAREMLDQVLHPQARRIRAALPSVFDAKNIDASETYDVSPNTGSSSAKPFVEALRALLLCRVHIERLREFFDKLHTQLSVFQQAKDKRSLSADVILASKIVSQELNAVHAALRSAPYPYEHSEPGASISRFCCQRLPAQKEIGAIHNAAGATLNGIFGLYMRLMADLADRAEKAEEQMGFIPLPEPRK